MNKKRFYLFFILTSFVFLVSGCGGGASGGAIFSAIENEVKLGSSSAQWATRSMVYYDGNLYCTNGNKIFTKGYGAGRGWTTISTPYDGAIGLLASDDNNLYVLHYKTTTEVTSSNIDTYNYADVAVSILYGTNAGQTVVQSGAMTIFDNQSTNGGREAFVSKYGGTCYKLSSSGTTGSNLGNCKGAVKTSSGSQLFNTHLVTKNPTTGAIYYINLIDNGTKISTEFIIRSSAGDINLENIGTNSLSSTKIGAITGLAYYPDKNASGEDKDYLLVATASNGYYRVSLDGTTVIDNYPHKNGERIAGLGIIDGSFWTFGKTIYAGITTSDKKAYGLWAYYDETNAGAWNLD